MGVPEDFIDFYRSQEGVFDIIKLTDEQFGEAHRIESGICTQAGCEYENIGFELLAKRQHRFCIYVEAGFRFEKKSHLKMMTGDTVTGMLLSPEEIPDYKERADVIWVSEDFVVFPDVVAEGEDRFVLYPYEFPELSELIPGCSNAIGASPAIPSDMYLKHQIGLGIDKGIFTFILGCDG